MVAVFKDGTMATNCEIELSYPFIMESTYAVFICSNIMNNAGRDWNFTFGSTNNHKPIIASETFIVTLEPLPLMLIKRQNITINKTMTVASIIAPHCNLVSDIEYLSYQCGMDHNNQKPMTSNCMFTCPVQPGSTYHVAIIRRAIKKYNGLSITNDTFPQETLPFNFYTGLLKIPHLLRVFTPTEIILIVREIRKTVYQL